jgi:hypothetical protein
MRKMQKTETATSFSSFNVYRVSALLLKCIHDYSQMQMGDSKDESELRALRIVVGSGDHTSFYSSFFLTRNQSS